jgi:phosphopantothenoylcysteine decarboxylase/phosphopantothenate--cysteine ligase
MNSAPVSEESQIPNPKPQIVLGVCGGIAAYKICELASHLTQKNFDVHVVMTQSAQRFVAPLTFQALTQNPVHTSLWPQNSSDASGVAAAMAHISLAEKADAILIAPATADIIAKLASGIADDLLTTLVLATRAPVLVAPAMNPQMLSHPATQKNLQILREFGYQVIEPETGRMACEHVGAGRLPKTEILVQALAATQHIASGHTAPKNIAQSQNLTGKKIVVTAGPTRENLDPVRFLSNRSSGKMGYAIAAEAATRGANVILISGPTNLSTPGGAARVDVVSTQQMLEAVSQHAPDCDVLIAAAAPADFAPAKSSAQKIKKRDFAAAGGAVGVLPLQLMPTPDILATVAKNKKPSQIFIGFAAETNSDLEEARRKLQDKNLDAICFNDITQDGAGFEGDTNRVTWISSDETEEWPLLSKREVAAKICERAAEILISRQHE